MKREASERRNTDDNGERVGVMYVGCNMVVDNGGGAAAVCFLVGRSVGGYLPAPSVPPRHLLLSDSLALFPCSQGKTLKSQQWSRREMGKKGRGMGHRGFGDKNI